MKKLDVVIPLLGSDTKTFLKGYNYIIKYLPVKNIVLISPNDLDEKVKDLEKITWVDENTLLPGLTIDTVRKIKYNISGSTKRSGWYFQQFLKMAYSQICQDDYYLIWDSDTIPLQDIPFFNPDNKPYIGYKEPQKFDDCYSPAQSLVLPNGRLKKKMKESFIVEHMLVKTSIMRELISEIEISSGKPFYEHIMCCVPLEFINLSGFSEYECYTAFILDKYPNEYVLRQWNNLRNGKLYLGDDLNKRDLNWVAQSFCSISIEDFDTHWYICKLFVALKNYWNIPFIRVYNILQPLANFVSSFRGNLRYYMSKL